MKSDDGRESVNEKVVLVLDDEGTIRRFLCKICKGLGVSQILDSGSVSGALELLRKHHVDLVISDLNILDESGLKIVKTIKSGGEQIAVLIFSGSYVETEKKKILAAGADMVLRKTVDLSELEGALCEMLHIQGPTAERAAFLTCSGDTLLARS